MRGREGLLRLGVRRPRGGQCVVHKKRVRYKALRRWIITVLILVVKPFHQTDIKLFNFQ